MRDLCPSFFFLYSQDVIEECSEEGEIIGGYECEEWSPIQYDSIIIDYCVIPDMPDF